MKWKCNACNTKVKGDTCPNCGEVLPDPATTPATERMRRALRSVPFVVAVIVFTLAMLLNIVSGLVPHETISKEDVHQAIETMEEEAKITLPDNVRTSLDEAMDSVKTDASDVISFNLMPLLACVGLWLLVATGFGSGRINKAGAVILKIITIMEMVAVCLGMAAIAALAAFLVFGREWLLSRLVDLGAWDSLVQALRSVMNEPLYETFVWAIAGVMLFALLIALFYLIGALKTENEVIRVSKIGQGRKVSIFLCVMMFIGAASCFGNGLQALLHADWWHTGSLLDGAWMLLFGIVILRYRSWSKELLWSDVNPEGVDKAFAAIPTDLGADELLNTAEYGATDAMMAAAVAESAEPEEPEELAEEPAEEPAEETPEEEPAEAPKKAESAVDQFMASIRTAAADAAPAAEKPAPPATTVCPNCGAVMKGKAFFCEECGQVL